MKIRNASAVPLLMLLLVGCETSAPFKTGVAAGGPRIAMHADAYLVGDNTTDEPTKEMRRAQAAQFRTATSPPITFGPVYDAWASLRPWMVDYSNADAALNADPGTKMLRADLIGSFDKLVEKERARRAIFFPFSTPGPIVK